MADNIQIIFWAATYILVILAGYTEINTGRKLISMPYAALIPNFSWEICAMQQSGYGWGHVLWLGLDVIIFVLNYKFIEKRSRKVIFILKTLCIVLVFCIIYQVPQGMLVSAFIIDFTMSIVFLVSFDKLSPYFKIHIATLKLIGSAVAGYYYYKFSSIVLALTVLVFLFNSFYLYMCIRARIRLGRKRYYAVVIDECL
ncbi:MAG: hypothetical protein IJA01_06425 [Firmicutes bacterium]|nr:hypothetical protein [Bacillota bacterium]